ncbi:MAG: substrate-binding domain-containing protein [Rhizobiaceae bacterium]
MRGIARLAQELGISTGTVSRALNGKRDVNDETRRKVLEAARRLGYAPNQAARALAQGTTRSVGFMIELDQETAASSDYFFMGVFDGVQSVLAQHGLDLLVLPCPTNQDRCTYLERFVARGVIDGMILASTQRVDKRIDLLQSAQIPFVTLGRSKSGHDYSWVDLDFEGVVATAIDRLVSLGHRRIAVTVPYGGVNFGVIFKEAYLAALKRHGLSFDPGLVFETKRNELAGYGVVDELLGLDEPPTAILLIYEVTAIGMYRRLAELGLTPGRDLAVIGFRDEPTVRFLAPAVTCFSVSLHELGVSIAEALLAQLPPYADRYPLGIVQKRCPLELVSGESDGVMEART